MLAENSDPQPYTYERNIETGKSKKLFLSIGKFQAAGEISTTAPYLFKEH